MYEELLKRYLLLYNLTDKQQFLTSLLSLISDASSALVAARSASRRFELELLLDRLISDALDFEIVYSVIVL